MSEKTNHQITRFLQKLAEKYPQSETPEVFTDIHIRVSQETGDMMAFDDEDKEITRVVVEEWINSPLDTEQFYSQVATLLRNAITALENQGKDNNHATAYLGIIEPYNYVLENETSEHVAELYVVDDTETMILTQPIMSNLSQELDDFINDLLKD